MQIQYKQFHAKMNQYMHLDTTSNNLTQRNGFGLRQCNNYKVIKAKHMRLPAGAWRRWLRLKHLPARASRSPGGAVALWRRFRAFLVFLLFLSIPEDEREAPSWRPFFFRFSIPDFSTLARGQFPLRRSASY